MRKIPGLLVFVSVVALFAVGCSIPFDIETDTTTIELPNTVGIYVEKEMEIPEDARREGLSFEEISLIYTVRADGTFSTEVTLYASKDQNADDIKSGAEEELLNVKLDPPKTEKSGVAVSQVMEDVLNARQAIFVIGAENLSTLPTSSIHLDIKLRLKGSYKLF